MSRPLPKPEQTDEVYLAEILDELRAIRAAVEPAPAPEPVKRTSRKPS